MTSPFRKAMVWLGLGPDEEYDDLDFYEGAPAARPGRSAQPEPDPVEESVQPIMRPRPAPGPSMSAPPPQTPAAPPAPAPAVSSPSAVRTLPPARSAGQTGRPPTTVRSMRPTSARPHQVTPESFDSAQQIGDRFKAGQPVAVDMGAVSKDLRRRLVDFCSGLCYALGGSMERVAGQTYLLVPADVDISRAERERLSQPG